MESTITRPQFDSEREEAEWWDAHPEYIEQMFRKAQAEGRLTHGTAAKRLGLEGRIPAQILLSKEDHTLASSQAQNRGVELHTYVESLLHRALLNAESPS